jgi:hypothetical protein
VALVAFVAFVARVAVRALSAVGALGTLPSFDRLIWVCGDRAIANAIARQRVLRDQLVAVRELRRGNRRSGYGHEQGNARHDERSRRPGAS